jgi:hypothetical protein
LSLARAFLASLPIGTRVALEGTGELAFSGEANLWPAANVLATPGLPLLGAPKIATTAGVTVGARWRLTGAFEVSATRTDERVVRLDIHRRARSALSVSARASIGATAPLARRDLFAWLVAALGADPEVDVLALVDAGLTNEQVTTLQQAVTGSLDRTLSLDAQVHLSDTRTAEALAAFEIDLSRVDAAAESALEETMRGSAASLGRVATSRGEHGVRLVSSTVSRLLRRRTRWRINLLGALNASGLSELVRRGSCTYDPIAGTLTIADEVASRRLAVSSRPFETDPDRLRRVLLESLIVTAAYRMSGALGTVDLRLRHAFIEQRGRASVADLTRCYAAIEALGLCDAAERERRLAAFPAVSRLTFVLECRLAQRRTDALFLDDAGSPHGAEHYERVARAALLALLPRDAGSRGGYRRLPLEDETTWARMKALGQPNLAAALPPGVARQPARVAVVTADYTTVSWWADAMHRAACALAEARAYVAAISHDALLPSDPHLREIRHRLERGLASVVSTTSERWGEPWDIVALHLASGRRAATRAAIVSPALTASYPGPAAHVRRQAAPFDAAQDDPGAVVCAPGSATARGRAPKRVSADAFTPAERDLLARHVVNLRDGALAGDGPGAVTDADVRRIFTEFLFDGPPAQRGPAARLVFVAHGGLVPEAEGLRSALARVPFWRARGLYPVCFVWRTGLLETLSGLARRAASAFDPRQAPRGPLLDAMIEAAVRVPGQAIWGQMKRDAERAVGPGGGARVVARLGGQLLAREPRVEVHAVGHSAGCIFLAHFVPTLLGSQRASVEEQEAGDRGIPRVDSLHFVAPAITTALFASRVKRLVGPGAPIRRFTLYALRADREACDRVGAYGKSLLHLVSRSCEPRVPTPLLGLQESLEQDVRLVRFFGLAGSSRLADALFAPTSPDAPPGCRTEATTHSGFDDDPATMDSIVWRMVCANSTLPEPCGSRVTPGA